METDKRKVESVKLYVAILNQGWIRRELVYTLLKMTNTRGVQVTLENLSKSFAQPIFSNRNRIARRFLDFRPKQDYLLMIDDDVLPLDNPAELVFADKDVIGMPAKVRSRGRIINWVAYMEHPDHEGYIPVDFEAVDDTIDLLAVDIIGTGCILIKREVIEKLFEGTGWDAPFSIELNDIGDSKFGTDFAFCRRAKKAGFKIYTTPQRLCEHVKEIGLMDIEGYDSSDGRDAVACKYAYPWDEFTITQNDWHFIRDVIEKKGVKTVLEFGSGLSSLLMSEMVDVYSFEGDKKHRLPRCSCCGEEIHGKVFPGERCNPCWNEAVNPDGT